jgi:CHAT domain-containing protein
MGPSIRLRMTSSKLPIACFALLSLILAAVWWYWRQPVAFEKVIAMGNRLEDRLPGSDETLGGLGKESESRWLLRGRKGDRVRLEGESYEFGVSLRLLDPMNRQIAMGDDNRRFFNAGIITSLPVTGEYTLIVSGANADQMGTYWLSLQEGDSEVNWSQSAAESFYRRGIQWAEESGSNRAACWLNLGMGLFLRQRGDRDQAARYYSEGLRRCDEKGDFTYGRWAIAIERGRLFLRLRSFDRALEEFQLALELSKNLRSAKEAEALVLIELGSLYNSMARVDLAKVYFRNATKQAEESGSPTTLVKLYTALNAVPELNDRDKAIEYAEKGYSLCSGLDPETELQAMHALAGTYLFLAMERAQEGLALAGQMRARARQIGCVDEEVAALTLMSMGNYGARDANAMIECARDAFALTSVTDEDPGPRRIALQLLADGEMERGNNQIALDWCLKALQTVEGAWRKENIEDLRRELLSQSKAICTQIIMNLGALNSRRPSSEYARQAFDYAERSRSRSLLEQLLSGSKVHVVDPQVLRRDQELTDRLSATRGQLALLRASSEASLDKLHRLQEERTRLLGDQMRLQAEVRSLNGNAYHAANFSPLPAEEVRKKLFEHHPKTAVLCYQLGIRKSFLIVLTLDSCRLFELGDQKQISKAIVEWRLQISSQQKPSQNGASDSHLIDEIAYNLYNILVKPAADIIEGRDLIVVPSDAVSTLAFEALVVRDPSDAQHSSGPKYLVQQHAITYAPSLSVLVEIEGRRQRTGSRRRMLLIGDPSVDGSETRIAGSGDQSFVATFDRIPAARKEIVDITRIARQKHIAVTSWLGSEASEARLKRSDLSAVQFLHIATHGIADPQDGGASALTLFPEPDGSQDGILTCDEIAGLKLNADLVVLSGCWTSSGQAAGAEGVVGLNRTFLLAGARCVCGSLWQVEDTWTQKLMSRFYSRLISDRLPKSQALRFAKLDLIRHGANPSQWAPFVLEGSPR